MVIQEKIKHDIDQINDADQLQLIDDFIKLLKRNSTPPTGNEDGFKKLAGIMSNEDAQEMMDIIDREFNNIEGEW